jgi:hypothetical protein
MPILLVPHVLLFLPVYLDRIASGILSRTPGPSSPRPVYQFMAYSSMALFAKQTIVALVDNEPEPYTHKHSKVLEYNTGYYGPLDRSTAAPVRILKSLGGHPATASVGWDVILCGFSLIVWAFVRRLEIPRITGNAGLNRITNEANANESGKDNSDQSHLKSAMTFDADRLGEDFRSESTRRRHGVSKSGGEDILISSVKVGNGGAGKPQLSAVRCALLALGGLGAIASGVLGAESEIS